MTQIGLLALQKCSVGIQLTAREPSRWNGIIPPPWGKALERPVTPSKALGTQEAFYRIGPGLGVAHVTLQDGAILNEPTF
jgi:hypothetical protein